MTARLKLLTNIWTVESDDMGKKIDLIGNRYGRLVVIEEAPRHQSGHARWLCKCDCGNTTKPVFGGDLRSGKVLSCGCLHKELVGNAARTHGKKQTRLYGIWNNMKNRCSLPSVPCYETYGDRGISVCQEWKDSFEAFFGWAMANGYEDHLTIDRIDNDGNYCPENCRWITRKAQANNLRKNIYIEINSESHTVAEWSNISGIKYTTIYRRYLNGWTGQKLLQQPK